MASALANGGASARGAAERSAPGVLAPRDRFVCKGEGAWVAPVVMEDLDLHPRYCVYQPPIGRDRLRVRFRDVPLGDRARALRGALLRARAHARRRPDRAAGEHRRPSPRRTLVHRDGDGWKRLALRDSARERRDQLRGRGGRAAAPPLLLGATARDAEARGEAGDAQRPRDRRARCARPTSRCCSPPRRRSDCRATRASTSWRRRSYARWFELLAEDPRAALEQANIDRFWRANHEHPALVKSLFALSLPRRPQALDSSRATSLAFRFPGMLSAGLLLWLIYIFGVRAVRPARRRCSRRSRTRSCRGRSTTRISYAFDVPITLAMTAVTLRVLARAGRAPLGDRDRRAVRARARHQAQQLDPARRARAALRLVLVARSRSRAQAAGRARRRCARFPTGCSRWRRSGPRSSRELALAVERHAARAWALRARSTCTTSTTTSRISA